MICCLVNVQDDHEEEEDKTQTNHVDSQVDYTDVYCRGTLLNSVWYSVTNNRVNGAVISSYHNNNLDKENLLLTRI